MGKMFKETILHLGSNMSDRLANLKEAVRLIDKYAGAVRRKSKVYETQPWGNTEQDEFLNMALLVRTTLPPRELLQTTLRIEQEMGRVRGEKWAPRIIDIDIILYEQESFQSAELIIPHPRFHERNFVLIPLLDIAANWVHPLKDKTIEELYWASTDPLDVFQLEETF